MLKNLCRRDWISVFFLKSHILCGIILLLVEQGGGISKKKVPHLRWGWELFPSLGAESDAEPPCLSPCWNPAFCDVGPLCVSVCLIATCASALWFSLAPLMLFSMSSQNSRTKWEDKQSFHMKRGQWNPGGDCCWDAPFPGCDHTAYANAVPSASKWHRQPS